MCLFLLCVMFSIMINLGERSISDQAGHGEGLVSRGQGGKSLLDLATPNIRGRQYLLIDEARSN